MVSQVAGQLIATKTVPLYSYLLSKIETTNAITVNFGGFNKLVEMTNPKMRKASKTVDTFSKSILECSNLFGILEDNTIVRFTSFYSAYKFLTEQS